MLVSKQPVNTKSLTRRETCQKETMYENMPSGILSVYILQN
jgi:hypothetical protein